MVKLSVVLVMLSSGIELVPKLLVIFGGDCAQSRTVKTKDKVVISRTKRLLSCRTYFTERIE